MLQLPSSLVHQLWQTQAFTVTVFSNIVDMPCRGYDASMLIGILPVATFCSGHTFFVQHMADVLGLQPYVVHATFQFSGTPGKRHRMREALLWNAVSFLLALCTPCFSFWALLARGIACGKHYCGMRSVFTSLWSCHCRMCMHLGCSMQGNGRPVADQGEITVD